ncbi:hypothetical protein D049_4343A, partial [Vibrio parahaemolyticus VPTS-2010]
MQSDNVFDFIRVN